MDRALMLGTVCSDHGSTSPTFVADATVVRGRACLDGMDNTDRLPAGELGNGLVSPPKADKIASPIASAAASILSVCFLTSCKSKARLSISFNNSSASIRARPGPANLSRPELIFVTIFELFCDMSFEPSAIASTSRTVATEEQDWQASTCATHPTCGREYSSVEEVLKVSRRSTTEPCRGCASQRIFSRSAVHTDDLQPQEHQRCRNGEAWQQISHSFRW